MDSNNFSSSPFLVLLYSALLISIQFPLSSSFDWFNSCSNNLGCGNITGVGFPFWGDGRPSDCGYPQTQLICKANQTKINITGVVYNVLEIDQVKQILSVVRTDFLSGFCSPSMLSTSFDSQIFEYDSDSGNLSLFYDCSPPSESSSLMPQLPGYFTCPKGSTYKNVYLSIAPYFPLGSCKRSLSVGVPKSYYGYIGNLEKMEEALREGFKVKYKVDFGACKVCTSSNGVCGYNWAQSHTVCYCQGHLFYDGKICIGGPVSASPQENTNESGMIPKVISTLK